VDDPNPPMNNTLMQIDELNDYYADTPGLYDLVQRCLQVN